MTLNAKGLLEALKELYLEGGIEISTSLLTYGQEDQDKNQSLLARTIIQPDADVITYLSEEISVHPNIWPRHLQEVEQKLKALKRLKLFLKYTKCLSLPSLLWAVKALLKGQTAFSAILFLISLVFMLTKTLAQIGFKWYLRRQFKPSLRIRAQL